MRACLQFSHNQQIIRNVLSSTSDCNEDIIITRVRGGGHTYRGVAGSLKLVGKWINDCNYKRKTHRLKYFHLLTQEENLIAFWFI